VTQGDSRGTLNQGSTSPRGRRRAARNVELQTRTFSRQPAAGEDNYQKLGVTPFLHAAGTCTVLLSSTSFRVPKRSGTWKLSRIGARQAM
jgi:hypothetical protein